MEVNLILKTYFKTLYSIVKSIIFLSGPCWKPVCLPSQNEHAAAGRSCHVAGWGRLTSGGSTPDKLQDVGINIMSTSYCYEKGFSKPQHHFKNLLLFLRWLR